MKSKRKGILLKLFNPFKLIEEASVKSVITKVSSKNIRIILVLKPFSANSNGKVDRIIPTKQKNSGGEIGLETNFLEKTP